MKSVRCLNDEPQRLAAMCLAPLRSFYVSSNSFEPLSEGTEEIEEWPELGSELVAEPKPEKCAARSRRSLAPRQPRRRRRAKIERATMEAEDGLTMGAKDAAEKVSIAPR